MRDEKIFHPICPTTESSEKKPKIYSVNFSGKNFGDTRMPLGTHDLVGQLNTWWDDICERNHLNPEDEKISDFGYYIIELGKNALEFADGGEIEVTLEPHRITVVVSDLGEGFEDQDDVEYLSSVNNHGLSQVRKYADTFVIETNGKAYTKVKGKEILVRTDASRRMGSKITFGKNYDFILKKD